MKMVGHDAVAIDVVPDANQVIEPTVNFSISVAFFDQRQPLKTGKSDEINSVFVWNASLCWHNKQKWAPPEDGSKCLSSAMRVKYRKLACHKRITPGDNS
jgi:hypothetical protein